MKNLVLSSGGIDSTTCLGIAVHEHGADSVATLSIYYGQRHEKELKAARDVAAHYGVAHYELDLSAIFMHSSCPLLSRSDQAIPLQSYAEQIAESGTGKVETYVPFRNGLFLSSAASLAMSLFPDDEIKIYIGAHADDAAGEAYADCSPQFIAAINQAVKEGTYQQCQITAPFADMNKAQVVKTGLDLNVPYQLTWSCYAGEDKPCGKCATCIDRERAFAMNGVKDPAMG
ncbi:MAG: 7-cyano-7-deazaguanine synthase QueC [Mailhella sp.]|nr:7-cyano-7-deazaguanine synthase QueC [Mailhella sp.]